MDNLEWIPIAEYAMKTGTSISTLRRKIKADAIQHKLEDGRYLLGFEKNISKQSKPQSEIKNVFPQQSDDRNDVQRPTIDLDNLRWRALEARVAGLAKKVEILSEQNSELKMLVKIFEERLNASL